LQRGELASLSQAPSSFFSLSLSLLPSLKNTEGNSVYSYSFFPSLPLSVSLSLSLFSYEIPPVSLKRKHIEGMEAHRGKGSTQRKHTEVRKHIEAREVE
jgi:hypothetical protein